MNRITRFSMLPFSVVLLMATDASWKAKPISQWSLDDAKQVLANSAWVKNAAVSVLPQRSEAQMRDGGRMGGSKGTGLGALDPSILTGLGGKHLVAKPAKKLTLLVRWESATPIRNAELKTGDESAPAWDGDYYAIAVYDVPGLEDQKTLPVELKRDAFLRRNGKKDLKPARVDLLFDEKGGATVVFLFPRTDEITKEDGHFRFAAQIGHLFLEQLFDTGEMQYHGKIEL